VEFLDSSGLSVMLRAHEALASKRRTLVIVCPPGPVRRVMEIARVDELLSLSMTPTRMRRPRSTRCDLWFDNARLTPHLRRGEAP
jgi:anti-anti-sigma regulatory factor